MEGTIRREQTGVRSLDFSRWIRDYLPQKRFTVTDIDFMFHNRKTGEWMLLEEKTRGGQMKQWQKEEYNLLGKRLRLVAEKQNQPFGGIWLITFYGHNATTPHNAERIVLENLESGESFTPTVNECIDFLSMVY